MRRIKSIEYIYVPTDDESILMSHYTTWKLNNIMIWGSDNTNYEQWLSRHTPEQKEVIIKKGYCTKGETFLQTGRLSDLMGTKKEEEKNDGWLSNDGDI